MRTYDVAIIGAGTAGLAALREVRKQTDDFVILNDGRYGTTCARVGCMPSKALIESANAFARREHFEELGIRGGERLAIDVPAVLEHVRALRDEFVGGILRLTDELGERSIAGRAQFVAPDTLAVNGQQLKARAVVIATGSRPVVPEAWRKFGARVLTSDSLFEQHSLPSSMAVIGMGAIGAEMAQALARLGIAVTAFGSANRVAALTDPQVNDVAQRLLGEEFSLHLGKNADLSDEGGRIRIIAGETTLAVDVVLAALGRRPNLDGLGLETLGVQLDRHGMPPFDRRSTQIADLPIFIAGDVTAEWPVLHVANDEGHIAGYNAARTQRSSFRMRTPLGIVYCDPNIAVVGARYAELQDEDLAVGAADFTRQGRARIARENRGLLRVYARKSDSRLLGAEMCAPRAEHLAHLLALAIDRRSTVQDLLRMPFYHPVFEEGLRTALRDVAQQLPTQHASDLATCDAVGADALD